MRFFGVCAALSVLVLALTAGVSASNGASATRTTLPSSWIDENNVFYAATCDYTQVINQNGRRESFRCTFDAAVPGPVVCGTPDCLWFSDFDGAEATETHIVINRAGIMVGWAKY